MDEPTNEQRRRASLRGKGREILLGQRASADVPPEAEEKKESPRQRPDHVDATALPLSPEEAAALLDFSPDSPAYDTGTPLPVAPPPVDTGDQQPGPVDDVEELPEWLRLEDPDVAFDAVDWLPDSDSGTTPVEPRTGDALPLGERDPGAPAGKAEDVAAYEPHPLIDALTPSAPESWSQPPAEPDVVEPLVELPTAASTAESSDDGGLLVPEEATVEDAVPAVAALPDPFVAVAPRQVSEQLFEKTAEPDTSLLGLLVDDERIRKLANQIEALQEDLVQHVESDRTTADLCMDELLQANSLLMASRENYDDARAIVFRIRADVNRQRKVHADISRYRPLLLNYYVGWGIALVVLFLLKGLFTGVTDAVGVGIVSALYYPMLLGVAGALLSGYLTLERHTTRLRDFDPIHISWYLFNPLLGGVMGLLMFLIASIANEDLLRESATDAEFAITYLLCVVAGMNQNNVLRQLNDLLKRFGRGSQD